MPTSARAHQSKPQQTPVVAKALRTDKPSAPSKSPSQVPTYPPTLRLSPNSPGEPLPLNVKNTLQNSLNANLNAVRIHSDNRARAAATALGAKAFTYGPNIFLGPHTQPTDLPLMAHEVTHVIQQHQAPRIQAFSNSSGDPLEHEAQSAASAVSAGQGFNVQGSTAPKVQRLGISDALDYFADEANNIPGFAMLTFILGLNPINMRRVERNATNLFRAIIGFLPGGNLIFEALQRHGILERVGNWIQQQLGSLGMAANMFRQALDRFLDSLGWSDIFDLGGVWERAKRIFTEPIDRIIAFLRGLVEGILAFIREAILRPVARLAEGTRGYDLLRLVMGQDPITGDPYPRTPENLIGGFMRLIGQEEKWQQLQQSGAIPRAWAWFQQQLGTLLGFVRQIPQLFVNLWQSLQIGDLLDIGGAFGKVRNIFGGFVNNFLSWAGNAAMQVMMFIFEVLAPGAMPVLRRAASVFRTIIADPIRFVGNLVRAGAQGFRQFASNIGTHLINGLVGWLTGALGGAGLQLPQRWDLRGILSLVLQILGLTWQNIRQKLVRHIGETAVTALETTFDIVVTLVREGPAAAWQKILEQLSNLQEMVFGQIREWVTRTVVGQAVTRIVSMLNPAGAVIQAIIATYNTIMFFRERLQQIMQVAEAFFNSIAQIASGAIGGAANYVEQTMARFVPVVISFLARLLGLGGISDTIRNIIGRIRAPIDRALDRVVDWIVGQARRLGSAVMRGARGVAQRVVNWWQTRKQFQANDGQSHTLYFVGEGQNARLMIASQPKTYTQFIDDIDVSGKPQNVQTAKANARAIAEQIDDMARAVRGTGMQNPQIIPLLNQLATHTAILAATTPTDPPSVIEYGGLNSVGGATRMNAPILSRNHVAGTEPIDNPPIWRKANRRPGVFVRGHLLNDNLGGPGRSYNLIPITIRANAKHHSDVERHIKQSVEQGSVVRYRVEPVYGTRPERSSQRQLRQEVRTLEMQAQSRPSVTRTPGSNVIQTNIFSIRSIRIELERKQRILRIMDDEQMLLPQAFRIDWKFLRFGQSSWEDDPTRSAPPIGGTMGPLPEDADFEPGSE